MTRRFMDVPLPDLPGADDDESDDQQAPSGLPAAFYGNPPPVDMSTPPPSGPLMLGPPAGVAAATADPLDGLGLSDADTDFEMHPETPSQFVDSTYASNDQSRWHTNQPQTKLQKLLGVLTAAGVGAMSGNAAASEAVARSGGHTSPGAGVGFVGGMQGVNQIQQNQLANQQRQAQVQLTQQKAAQFPLDRAAWRNRLDAATQYAYARANAEGHKILKTTVDADGNVSVFSQDQLGRVIQQHVGKIKPKADIRAVGGALYEQGDDGNWQQVVAPKPVPGRDVPYSSDVEAQQKRIHATEPKLLPGRDIPYSPAVEDQYNRMHPNSTGSPSGATLAAIENRKGDALMRIEKDPTLTDDEREQMKQAVQDKYENQLRIAGSPVPHFSYSTQGKGKKRDPLGIR